MTKSKVELYSSEEDLIHTVTTEMWNLMVEIRDMSGSGDNAYTDMFADVQKLYLKYSKNTKLRDVKISNHEVVSDTTEVSVLKDCIKNFMGILDTPVGRQQYKHDKMLMAAVDYARDNLDDGSDT